MPRTFTAKLAPRQSAALWLMTAVAVAVAMATFASLAAAAESLVVWCHDFVVAASAGRGAAAIVTAAALGAVVLAALANVASFLFQEAVSAARLARTTAAMAVATPGRVCAALASVGASSSPCVTVEDDAPFAVTAGVFAPRIVISTGLVARLTLSELRAVLAHEAHHGRARHPLRAVAWESFRRAFFFLPALADVARHFSLARELDADRAAVRACRGARPLASAMLKAVSAAPAAFPVGAAAFGQLQPRINALRGDGGTELRVSVRRMAATVAFIAALFVAHLSLGSAPALAASGAAETQCKDAVRRDMMRSIDFTPYFSILVPQMSRVQPVQSREIRP